MRKRFFVEVDAEGSIVSVEEGELSSLPAELMPLLGRFALERVLESGFIWAPEAHSEACQIQIAPASLSGSGQLGPEHYCPCVAA